MMKKIILLSVSLFLSLLVISQDVFAVVTVTPATGGSAISADTTGGTYTSLTGPVIIGGASGDVGVGTIILNAPSGFIFDTGGTVPTVLITRTAGTGGNGDNINGRASGTSEPITSITTTLITFTVTSASKNGAINNLTWQNVRVRPTAGTPLASGNILKTGTSVISGVTDSVTNLGTLTEVVGVKSQLVMTTQPSSTAVGGVDFTTKPVVVVRDQFGNTITSDNSTTIALSPLVSTQICGGVLGSGILTSTPVSGAAVTSGVMTYTAMQYSASESIKICATSAGMTSALSSTVTVTAGPTPTPTPSSSQSVTGTINVVKVVVNDNGGTKTIADFPLFIGGQSAVSGQTYTFSAPGPLFTVTETGDPNYTRTFSGDCDFNGQLNLNPGQNKFCIITNNDNDISAGITTQPMAPLIEVIRVPMPLSLPAGPGPLIYAYTLRNIGTVPVTTVNLFDDDCDSVELISGDTNNDSRMDVSEVWMYACSTIILETSTGTVTATGWANGISAIDIASSTVIVGLPGLPETGVVPPLIHVTKVPNPLALPAGGGTVIYTNAVTNPGMAALDYVYLTDDHCSPIKYVSGDINEDRRLDIDETWTYTCQANLTETTTNTVKARGEANGLIARDLAIVTVVVSANPSLPNAGSSSTFTQQVKSITIDLSEGSMGSNVNILQKFLVSENKGPAARALGAHGTTFYFGPLTKAALIEWQQAVGIAPATGTFGAATRGYIGANYISATPNLPNTGLPSVPILRQQVKSITIDLSEGSMGSNVNILQKFLVSENKGPAARALGAHGTTFYFGPLTKAALIEWQQAVGIAPATGTFGAATRGYIGANY